MPGQRRKQAKELIKERGDVYYAIGRWQLINGQEKRFNESLKVAIPKQGPKGRALATALERLRERIAELNIEIEATKRTYSHAPMRQQNTPSLTVKQLKQLRLQYLAERNTNQRHLNGNYRSWWAQLEQYFCGEDGAPGDHPVQDIDSTLLEQYKAHRAAQAASVDTYQRELRELRPAMNLAHRKGLIPAVPPFHLEHESRTRTFHLTHTEVEAVLKAVQASKEHRWALSWFTILFFTGARLQEAAELRRRDFDLEKDTVTIHHDQRTKGGRTKTRARRLELNETVRQWLIATPCRFSQDYVLVGPGGSPLKPTTASQKLGKVIAWLRANELVPDGFWLRDTRHVFAYMAAAHCAELRDLMRLMGHTNEAMTERYAGFLMNRSNKAIKAIKVDISFDQLTPKAHARAAGRGSKN